MDIYFFIIFVYLQSEYLYLLALKSILIQSFSWNIWREHFSRVPSVFTF